MISPANIPENPISDTNQNSGGGRQNWYLKPQEENLKCPRCDSHNTKFCYYNNYSLTQPRYFCKTCRRYWTKGGTLRNIPIGGSCRKTKKTKSNSTISIDSKESSETNNGLKFSNGFSQSIEFQLGGSGGGCFNQFVSNNPSCFDIGSSMNYCSLMGVGFNGGIEDMGSIESLNYVRPERLGLVFGGENQERSVIVEDQTQKTPPILFQNMEMSKPEAYVVSNPRESNVVSGNITEWLFESSSNWSGMQACIDLHQYSSLP